MPEVLLGLDILWFPADKEWFEGFQWDIRARPCHLIDVIRPVSIRHAPFVRLFICARRSHGHLIPCRQSDVLDDPRKLDNNGNFPSDNPRNFSCDRKVRHGHHS